MYVTELALKRNEAVRVFGQAFEPISREAHALGGIPR